MRRRALMLGLTLAVGIALAVTGNQVLNAQYAQQQAPLKVTDVLKADVVGMEGTEVVVQLVEFAPRGATGKHAHPGHEVAYVLEGSGIREMDGHPPMTSKGGDVMYIPAKHVHETKNVSTTEPLKVLFFRIHPKGQPIVTVRVTEPHFLQ